MSIWALYTLSSRPWHANNDYLKRDDSVTCASVDVGIDEELGKTLMVGHSALLGQRRTVRHSCRYSCKL